MKTATSTHKPSIRRDEMLTASCTRAHRAILATGLAVGLLFAPLAADTPPTPAARWLLDGAVGATNFSAEGGGYAGSLDGAQFVEASYRGNALLFSGSAYASIGGNAESLLAGNNWSVSLWFRRNTQTDGGSRLRTIFASGDAGGSGVSISAERGNGNNLQFRVGSSEVYLPFPFDLAWHHVVLVRDGATARAYVDGALVGTFPAGAPTLAPIRLGRDSSAVTTRFFRGYVDEAAIYDHSLTADEVSAVHMAHPLPPMVSVPYISTFAGGTMGYYCFRIPAILRAADGSLLAFAEARTGNCSDTGDIDTVVRRSTDNGVTWGPIITVWDDGPNTAGNPCPVLDRDTGRIWMINTHNLGQDTQAEIQDGTSDGARTVWVCYSDDHGETWTTPHEITSTVKLPDWRWYATGPGVSIQDSQGRLIVPATRNTGAGGGGANSFVFHSDDHGATWRLSGGMASDRVSEAQVVELSNGQLMLNMRRTGSRPLYRAVSRSINRGAAWSAVVHDMALPSSGVQGSILRYTLEDLQDADRIVFSNPANNTDTSANSRTKMTLRVSLDEANSWAYNRELHAGWSAYSSTVITKDFRVGCMYEWGTVNRYEAFVFESANLEWLSNGADATPAVTLPPKGVMADVVEGVGVVVLWDAVPGALGYELLRYKAGDAGTAAIVATVPAGETSWEDNDVSDMSGYYYRLRTLAAGGRSHDSAPAFVSTAPPGVLLVPAFYPTIEGAIRAAQDGDEIRVAHTHVDPSHSIRLKDKNLTIRSYRVGGD
jgi:sialidase-1